MTGYPGVFCGFTLIARYIPLDEPEHEYNIELWFEDLKETLFNYLRDNAKIFKFSDDELFPWDADDLSVGLSEESCFGTDYPIVFASKECRWTPETLKFAQDLIMYLNDVYCIRWTTSGEDSEEINDDFRLEEHFDYDNKIADTLNELGKVLDEIHESFDEYEKSKFNESIHNKNYEEIQEISIKQLIHECYMEFFCMTGIPKKLEDKAFEIAMDSESVKNHIGAILTSEIYYACNKAVCVLVGEEPGEECELVLEECDERIDLMPYMEED